MNKLVLNRINDEVYYNDIKLKINKQASKGPGQEVVYVKDCPEANGQTWISLSRIKDGLNEFECKPRNITISKKYELTQDEQDKVNELQSQIDEIIQQAKDRYVPIKKIDMNFKVENLTEEQKEVKRKELQQYLDMLK